MTDFAKHKVLILHALRPTSRQTTIDHLYSFRHHLPQCDVQYLHFQQSIPDEIGEVSPDLLIVNYDFLNYRFTPLWPYIKNRHRQIARAAGRVVAIAQDDFWANELLDDWCMSWDVDRILTPIDNDRHVLYPRAIKSKEFRTGLTGYVRSGPTPTTKPLRERPIDLGQRVREMPPHLGRLAQAKSRQALAMAEAARQAGFVVDVSNRVEDSFIGTAWSEFLATCKFTVGMKGGASLHDPKGLIHARVQSYLASHPNADFDEIERRCFKGKDMRHVFTAISPRLFEAALAGTCQILERDDYLGILEPWRHYIPLDKDFSNIDEVVNVMHDLDRCQEIAANARLALVDSGVFDYKCLVEAATNEYLSTDVQDDWKWASLAGHLMRSSAVQTRYGPELHDACLHLISELVLEMTNKQVSALIKYLNNEVMPTKCGQIFENHPARAGIFYVLNEIQRLDQRSWFIEQLILARRECLSLRSPWTWRSPPRDVWEISHVGRYATGSH
jgi:hypothetical protein